MGFDCLLRKGEYVNLSFCQILHKSVEYLISFGENLAEVLRVTGIFAYNVSYKHSYDLTKRLLTY